MKIQSVAIENIRGFSPSGSLVLSRGINLLVGQNNSGKSTIINAILQLQKPSLTYEDISLNMNEGNIRIYCKSSA